MVMLAGFVNREMKGRAVTTTMPKHALDADQELDAMGSEFDDSSVSQSSQPGVLQAGLVLFVGVALMCLVISFSRQVSIWLADHNVFVVMGPYMVLMVIAGGCCSAGFQKLWSARAGA